MKVKKGAANNHIRKKWYNGDFQTNWDVCSHLPLRKTKNNKKRKLDLANIVLRFSDKITCLTWFLKYFFQFGT